MLDEVKKIEQSAKEGIKRANSIDELDEIRIRYLGREQGALTAILRKLKELPPEERKAVGEAANELRQEIENALAARKEELASAFRESQLEKERLDVTRPGIKVRRGHLHPITRIIREITEVFSSMGFAVAEGPEVETEYYNFDALNIPANHPARDMWDTFWIKERGTWSVERKSQVHNPQSTRHHLLLRTHTSPVQIRYMEKHNPPIRIIVPGRAYRYEATDATHEIQFFQLEGLMADKGISIANFKSVIQEFFSGLFNFRIVTRLRPSYFPFTEPSFEVDITCVMCKGKGCAVCQKTGWLELGGAGMVHPNVFKAAGYNPKEIQGFAFGFGIERLAMMKYKIPDIRMFNSGDLRFLEQF